MMNARKDSNGVARKLCTGALSFALTLALIPSFAYASNPEERGADGGQPALGEILATTEGGEASASPNSKVAASPEQTEAAQGIAAEDAGHGENAISSDEATATETIPSEDAPQMSVALLESHSPLAQRDKIAGIAAQALQIAPFAAPITGNGYVFDPNSGLLTITSNAGFAAVNSNYSINNEKFKKLVMEPEVTEIPEYAFWGKGRNISEIVLSPNLEVIGKAAFGRHNVTSLDFPASLTRIGASSLTGLHLSSADLSNTKLTTIDYFAFAWMFDLKSVSFPSSLTSIGEEVFLGTGIETLDLSSCTALTDIGNYAFCSCSSLTNVKLPDSLASIGTFAFANTKLTDIDLSAYTKLDCINEAAFSGCENLTSVSLPPSIKTLENAAFKGCLRLTTLDLSDCSALTSIGEFALGECLSLQTVIFPPSLTTMARDVFDMNNNLKELYFYGYQAPQLASESFRDIPQTGTVYYPEGGTNYNAGYFNAASNIVSSFDQWDFVPLPVPVLEAGAISRSSDNDATITFSSDTAGQYYYDIVKAGDTAPAIDTTGTGISCDTSEQTITFDSSTSSLGAGAKDVYITVKGPHDFINRKFFITVPEFYYPVLSPFGEWTGEGNVSARIDAECAKFSSLLLDGQEVDASNYSIASGSTIITLNQSYLLTIDDGDYSFVAKFSDGTSESFSLHVAVPGRALTIGAGSNLDGSSGGGSQNNNGINSSDLNGASTNASSGNGSISSVDKQSLTGNKANGQKQRGTGQTNPNDTVLPAASSLPHTGDALLLWAAVAISLASTGLIFLVFATRRKHKKTV